MEKLELRMHEATFESVSDGQLKVSGYVNKTNQWSQELGLRKKFVERILPGTFEKAIIRGKEINFLAEHDNAKILSSTRNGSLSLREDEQGLYMEATIAPTSWGKDYHTLIQEGIIQNMSFGMKVLRDSWKKLPTGVYERSIDDLDLVEVSAVRNPAYVQSTIQARSIEVVEDVEIPAELDENREGESQMDLETRDKLADVLDKILVTLENQAKPAEVVVEEPAKDPEPAPSVDEPVVEEKPAEQVEKVVEETPPAQATEQPVVEEPKAEEKPAVEEPKTEEKPVDLTQYYKKMLDF